VLELREIARPQVADDEVLLPVHAAGVDLGVWHLMTGLPYLVRPVLGLRRPKNPVRGREVAGRVEAVGANVTRFRPGDEVIGIGEGTFAEYAAVREDKLALKPVNLTFEQSAAVPISATMCWSSARRVGWGRSPSSSPRRSARTSRAGARRPKMDLVRSLGAEHVVDHTREDIVDAQRRYDLILDCGGRRSIPHLRRALAPRGRLVIVGGEGGGRWTGGFGRGFRAAALSLFVRQQLGMLVATERGDDLRTLSELMEEGKVTPVVDRTYPPPDAPAALRYLKTGHVGGKLVVTMP
jgi:NADPH:quinone reductase-like Zn-dependent oxidoreductase